MIGEQEERAVVVDVAIALELMKVCGLKEELEKDVECECISSATGDKST